MITYHKCESCGMESNDHDEMLQHEAIPITGVELTKGGLYLLNPSISLSREIEPAGMLVL